MLLIAVFTYVIVGIVLNIVGVPRPWIAALIPPIGFALSTFSLPLLKTLWLRHIANVKR